MIRDDRNHFIGQALFLFACILHETHVDEIAPVHYEPVQAAAGVGNVPTYSLSKRCASSVIILFQSTHCGGHYLTVISPYAL